MGSPVRKPTELSNVLTDDEVLVYRLGLYIVSKLDEEGAKNIGNKEFRIKEFFVKLFNDPKFIQFLVMCLMVVFRRFNLSKGISGLR